MLRFLVLGHQMSDVLAFFHSVQVSKPLNVVCLGLCDPDGQRGNDGEFFVCHGSDRRLGSAAFWATTEAYFGGAGLLADQLRPDQMPVVGLELQASYFFEAVPLNGNAYFCSQGALAIGGVLEVFGGRAAAQGKCLSLVWQQFGEVLFKFHPAILHQLVLCRQELSELFSVFRVVHYANE